MASLATSSCTLFRRTSSSDKSKTESELALLISESVVEVISPGPVGVDLAWTGEGLRKFFHHFYIILHEFTGDFWHLYQFCTGSNQLGSWDSFLPISCELGVLAKVLLTLLPGGEVDPVAAAVTASPPHPSDRWEVRTFSFAFDAAS